MIPTGRYRHHQRHRFDRLPPGVRSVTRPSRWGNPHKCDVECLMCGVIHDRDQAVDLHQRDLAAAVVLTRLLAGDPLPKWLEPLAAADGLACRCPTDARCHGDLLLELLDHHHPQGNTP